MRRFVQVSKYVEDLKAPIRSTQFSAGYDFFAAEDTVVPSMWKAFQKDIGNIQKEALSSTLVPLGFKVQMPEDEFLMLVNRSSSPMKRQLALPNGVGIIDADYYNNAENEGEIFLQLINYGAEDYLIKKGDRICQGIFQKYYLVDGEEEVESTRQGGFGSSGW